MDAICVREDISRHTLAKLGIKNPVFSLIDMAFFFEAKSISANPLKPPVIGVSPCFVTGMSDDEKKSYIKALSGALSKLQQNHNASIVFLPSQTRQGKAMVVSKRQDDCAASRIIQKNLAELIGSDQVETVVTDSVDDFVSLLANLNMLIATRMHPTIFAAGKAVPFVEIIYEHKQIGLLDTLHMQDLGVSVNEITVEKLLAKAEYVWTNRTQLSKRLIDRVSELRAQHKPVIEKLITSLIED